jgi:hypothetical protein
MISVFGQVAKVLFLLFISCATGRVSSVPIGCVYAQVLPMVGNFIFVRQELLPGFLIKVNIKN